MKRAWLFQDDKQVKKLGKPAASWYVGWMDPAGKRRCKSFGRGTEGKRLASSYRRKVEAELLTGTYNAVAKKTWEAFRAEYDSKILDGKGPRTRDAFATALGHFERIVKPAKMVGITTTTIAEFVSARQKERGVKPGSSLSPATINRDLRHIRAALKKAHKWDYLAKLPDVADCFLREPGKLPTYVPPEHFAALYQACGRATFPQHLPYPAEAWWRGLLVFAYMTGWRIGSILALRQADVNLAEGRAVSRAEDNKGKRDQVVLLHPLVVQHLEAIRSFEPVIFPWNHGRRHLFIHLHRIQQAAKVKPDGKDFYGFHDLRRAFATMNAASLTPDALQAMMQHKDYQTTQRYINMARQLKPAVQALFVPNLSTNGATAALA
jgi:integrase